VDILYLNTRSWFVY